MAGPFKASFYLNSNDAEGWSENFYVSEADINTAATTAAGYIAPRMALSANNIHMVFGKVSDVTVKGDSLIVLPMSGNYPFVGTYTESPAGCFLEANTALLIELLAGATKKNRIFLRGLTLDVVTGRELLSPSGWASGFATWLTFIKTHFQVRKQVVPHTTPPTYTYTDADNAYFQRVTARKPGRPFGEPRGRKFSHRGA